MIENEFYNGEFEQLLKEKADQFSMYPSKRVWHSIYNNLHPSRRWPSLVMSLLLITSLSLIGYLNTGDNKINPGLYTSDTNNNLAEINNKQISGIKEQNVAYTKNQLKQAPVYNRAFDDVITNETDFYAYTIVKNNRPFNYFATETPDNLNQHAAVSPVERSRNDVIPVIDAYIKTNKLFADIAISNKNNRIAGQKSIDKTTGTGINSEDIINNPAGDKAALTNPAALNNPEIDLIKLMDADKKAILKSNVTGDKQALTNEEKAWIENYASQLKQSKNKFKNRLAFQFYATPAVNYRKLTTRSKGSTTAFATADINSVISQKPGLGIEAGAAMQYTVAKRLQLKAGLQFNYTNYNIAADQTNHPIITTILLNDPNTGYSYSAARTSTTSNVYNSSALQPVTLHNRTYQVSVPVGLAYKLSSEKNVDWYAGASVQPTYFFGGNAHLISSDLKSYVSDPSSIRTWNLNLGFETFMNFKLGSYHLQVGPQVRYQVYSTYRKDVALIEKPYAVGLKFGLTKGF